MDDIQVSRKLVLPASELSWRFSRSGGPGGQHANTSATRVELIWDLAGSPSLSENQRARIRAHLVGRLDEAGRLRLVVEESRSQHRNRELAVERLRELLAEAIRPRKKRRATQPSRAAKQRRLDRKKQRGQIKRDRQRKDW